MEDETDGQSSACLCYDVRLCTIQILMYDSLIRTRSTKERTVLTRAVSEIENVSSHNGYAGFESVIMTINIVMRKSGLQ